MSGPPALEVEGLGKRYRVGGRAEAYPTLRDALTGFAAAPWQALRGALGAEERWVLQDVSFQVSEGEVLGVVGRNGAGKTTLLKLLARITPPSAGRARVHGRLGALLDVGAGFHWELSGRENVFFSGALLGMRRAEIARKLDAIVDFAGVGAWLDVPVKRYSSGMYMRLAFSVAAHLEPDVLLVDEVLAVGDADFQRRCLGRMESVAREGRTVLFVSHDLGAVETLCPRALLLEDGRLVHDGPARETVHRYLERVRALPPTSLAEGPRSGTGELRLVSCRLESPAGEALGFVKSGDPVVVVIGFERRAPVGQVSFELAVSTPRELELLRLGSHEAGPRQDDLPERGEVRCTIPRLPLTRGDYLLGLRALSGWDELDRPHTLLPLRVEPGDFHGQGAVTAPAEGGGYFLTDATWSRPERGA